jgi:hypothetical protein
MLENWRERPLCAVIDCYKRPSHWVKHPFEWLLTFRVSLPNRAFVTRTVICGINGPMLGEIWSWLAYVNRVQRSMEEAQEAEKFLEAQQGLPRLTYALTASIQGPIFSSSSIPKDPSRIQASKLGDKRCCVYRATEDSI